MTPEDQSWNAFLDRSCGLAEPIGAEVPFYALWLYHGQVCNGGHHQYFQNLFDRRADWDLAAEAARLVGAMDVAENLEAAIRAWDRRGRSKIRTLFAFSASAQEREFEAFDARFFGMEKALVDRLEAVIVKRRRD